MRFPLAIPPAFLLLVSIGAHADTYTTFNVDVMFQQGAGSGTATLDDSSGSFSAADITVAYLGSNYVFNSTPVADSFGSFSGFSIKDSGGDTMSLFFPVTSFAGYTGGGLCNPGGNCTFGSGPQVVVTKIEPGGGSSVFPFGDTLVDGAFTQQASTTPEPSTLLLLGAGLLGVAGIARHAQPR